ncbi:MAG: hypothetical protein ACREEP_15885 [Dongiaceae bacterium]
MYGSEPQTASRSIASQLAELLSRRSVLVLAGSAATLAGAVYSWDWLVALGVAPLLLGVLPCVAMCALGLCMNRAGGQACAKDTGSSVPAGERNKKELTP